jgi:hypothetical protein
MEKKLRKIFLIIAISSSLLFVPAYLSNTDLSKIVLFYADLNPKNDDQFDVQNYESDTFLLIIFSIRFFPGVNRFEQFYQLLPQILSFNPKSSILRC